MHVLRRCFQKAQVNNFLGDVMGKKDIEREFDDEVYEDEFYEENYDEEELLGDEELNDDGEIIDNDEELVEDDFEEDDEDLLEEDDEDAVVTKKTDKKRVRKIDVSYACEDCDYRWEDVIFKRKDVLEDDEEFEVICPMCGSVNVTQI